MTGPVYTIWPADREGMPARGASAWRQEARWLVLDVTDGLDAVHVVEGPVSRQVALKRELELRVVAREIAKATKDPNLSAALDDAARRMEAP